MGIIFRTIINIKFTITEKNLSKTLYFANVIML